MIDFSLIGRSDWLRGKCKFFFWPIAKRTTYETKAIRNYFRRSFKHESNQAASRCLCCYLFFCNHTTFSFFKTLSSAVERLKVCDDAFRKQLEQERRAHEQQLQTLANEKQQEVERANNRVRKESEKSCWSPQRLYIRGTSSWIKLWSFHLSLKYGGVPWKSR